MAANGAPLIGMPFSFSKLDESTNGRMDESSLSAADEEDEEDEDEEEDEDDEEDESLPLLFMVELLQALIMLLRKKLLFIMDWLVLPA